MSIIVIGLYGIVALLVAIAVRLPIGLALAFTGFLGYAAADGWSRALRMLGSVPYDLAHAYSLSVVPLFLLMGAVASRGIMAQELFDAANAVFSGLRGALANATTGACALFGGICGSSIADAATFSRVAIPEMRRHGYDPRFAAGTVASAGTLAILIPPSVLTALYAIVAEQSLVKLYAAAFMPGLILALLYVLTVLIVAYARPAWVPRVVAMPLAQRLRAIQGMWKLALLFGLAVGGIYFGWFSPTEAASVASFAAIVIACATRTIRGQDLLAAFMDTVYATATVFFIVVGAFIYARFIVLTQLPTGVVTWVQSHQFSPLLIIISVLLLYALLGTFLDEVSTILLTVPVTLPLVTSIGYDGIWFGIFVTVMCTIGLISPPTGLTVFVIQAQHPDIPVEQIYLGTLPFLVADCVLIALLIAFPGIALWMPRVLGM
jgi:C4-dicarboxylate transporter DctM subunit